METSRGDVDILWRNVARLRYGRTLDIDEEVSGRSAAEARMHAAAHAALSLREALGESEPDWVGPPIEEPKPGGRFSRFRDRWS